MADILFLFLVCVWMNALGVSITATPIYSSVSMIQYNITDLVATVSDLDFFGDKFPLLVSSCHGSSFDCTVSLFLGKHEILHNTFLLVFI